MPSSHVSRPDADFAQAPTLAWEGRLSILPLHASGSGGPFLAATSTQDGAGSEPMPGLEETVNGSGTLQSNAPLPRCLGRYHILERLGVGGMGVVFAAYDPDLDRKVAVKLLHGGGHDSQLRMLREAQALARLSHPNVVQIHDASVAGAQVFIAMEFVRGRDLRAWLAAEGRSEAQILGVFLEAARGLAAAHTQGLVHRDFKPENVLVGDDGRARVADFGLARAGTEDEAPRAHGRATEGPLDVSLTATGAVIGTPAYMSPEQYLGERADARSDQFSLCVSLWEALYRQRPFAGESLPELVMAVQRGVVLQPPPENRVPRRIEAVLRRGLALHPAHRYPDMYALIAALEHDPARTRRRWLAGFALVSLSAGVAAFIADRRADEALSCSGAETELADAWDSPRRAAVIDALSGAADADALIARLDDYSGRWSAAHRDACRDRRRGELSDAGFDLRSRCLERRRLALGSATRLLAGTVPDPAQLVARLPALRSCADAARAADETTAPEDEVLAATVYELDARLIDTRARYHAGDLAGALSAAQAILPEVRATGFRPLLAEALLLLGELQGATFNTSAGGAAVTEAAIHALATGRDELAAEALARALFFGGFGEDVDRALAGESIARAVAERLPEPAVALARLHHNVAYLHHFVRRDEGAARPYFTQAAAALERTPEGDPVEFAAMWGNLAVAQPQRAARDYAFSRALEIAEGHLGPEHVHTLTFQRLRGLYAPDARASAEILTMTCPRFLRHARQDPRNCATCFYELGHVQTALGEPAASLQAFDRVAACTDSEVPEAGGVAQLELLRARTDAFAALLRDEPEAAARASDRPLAERESYASMWWITAEYAQLDLAQGDALLALDRPEEALAALARAIPVLEDLAKTRGQLLDTLWLDKARRLRDAASP